MAATTYMEFKVKEVRLQYWYLVLCSLFLPSFLAGCSESAFDTNKPTVLTFWHVYGGQTNSPMNLLVEQFNQTVGKKEGITINVTSLSNSTDIHFAAEAAAKKLPGAGELPDLLTVYPKTAMVMSLDLFADWNDLLDPDIIAALVPPFVEEGTIDDRLVLLPLAKSSSALFINATIFDQFSAETGITYDSLATWEGMFTAAGKYHELSGGKAFFKYDDWMHYGMMNTASLGGQFFRDDAINFDDAVFRSIWKKLAVSALSGEVSLLGGYATTGMMTGEVLCGIESTASILYFKDKVTFSDNTSIPLHLKVRPVPIFEGGKAIAIQRGGGLGFVRSTPEKAKATAIFARWLLAPENNVPFVTKTGYFPVTTSAYSEFMDTYGDNLPTEGYREVYRAVEDIHATFAFYPPPFFDAFGTVEKEYCDAQMAIFKRNVGKVGAEILQSEAFLDGLFEELREALQP